MPDQREVKPLFSDIPPPFLQRCGSFLGSPVKSASIAYGGLSASASFIFMLDDGRKIFAKGNHPLEMSHGAETLRQETHIYKTVSMLSQLSPPYLGMVSEGDDHQWSLAFWQAVEAHRFDLTLDDCAYWIQSIQKLPVDTLRSFDQNNYLSQIFNPGKKWRRVMEDSTVRAAFCDLFADPALAQDWANRCLPVLVDWQSKSLDHCPRSFMHGDLRLDNFIADQNRIYVIDWANASCGPAVFDPVFLFAHLDGLGEQDFDALWRHYMSSGGCVMSDEDKMTMMVKLSGYFATQAYRPVPDKMPRLRWMQKTLLFSLLNRLSRYGLIDPLPQIAGLNPEFRFEC